MLRIFLFGLAKRRKQPERDDTITKTSSSPLGERRLEAGGCPKSIALIYFPARQESWYTIPMSKGKSGKITYKPSMTSGRRTSYLPAWMNSSLRTIWYDWSAK
jgi:hypothetical protein